MSARECSASANRAPLRVTVHTVTFAQKIKRLTVIAVLTACSSRACLPLGWPSGSGAGGRSVSSAAACSGGGGAEDSPRVKKSGDAGLAAPVVDSRASARLASGCAEGGLWPRVATARGGPAARPKPPAMNTGGMLPWEVEKLCSRSPRTVDTALYITGGSLARSRSLKSRSRE